MSHSNCSSRHSAQDVTLKAFARDMTTLKTQFAQIDNSHYEVKESVLQSNRCYEGMRDKLNALKDQKKESDKRISQLEKQLQDIQLQTRPASIELRNVRLLADESTQNLTAVVLAVAHAIEVELPKHNLRDVYRLPATSTTPGPIVAEFISVLKKNEFLSNARRYNHDRRGGEKLNSRIIGLAGEKKPIYVDEHGLPGKRKPRV